MLCVVIGLLVLPILAQGITRTHEWNITYTNAAPDGFRRRVMGVNGKWPPPTIELDYGDQLVLKVNNQLDDVDTGLHAHGLFQRGTNYYDGAVGVTQCGIPPGESMTYNFTVEQNGTYWIHSHVVGQYPDGLRSPLIIHNSHEPYEYDEEIVISFSDWYHKEMSVNTQVFMNLANPSGAEPVPDSALINDSQNETIKFEAGKTYRLRFINMAAFAMFHVWIESHDMRVIEVDGVYTKPYVVQGIELAAAQRVSVLVTAKNSTDQNFPIVGAMDADMFDKVPQGSNLNVTAWVSYSDANENPQPARLEAFYDWDDTLLTPLEPEPVIDPDVSYQLDVLFETLSDGENYAMFNEISYKHPNVPSILTALTVPSNYSTISTVYGSATHPIILDHNNMVQIVVNNGDQGKHPFHLHGHVFQVVYRSEEGAGVFNESVKYNIPDNPMRRDTCQIPPEGFAIFRFRADNPGVWLFHCHIEWHVISGLVATMVEAPLQIQQNIKFPDAMLEQCKSQGIPVAGNAVGNTVDFLDLTGELLPPKPLPAGFTAKGYVAMAGCVISAIMGLATIIWYGLTESPELMMEELSSEAGDD